MANVSYTTGKAAYSTWETTEPQTASKLPLEKSLCRNKAQTFHIMKFSQIIGFIFLKAVWHFKDQDLLCESGVERGRGSEPELHGIGRGFLTNAYF